MWNFSRKFWNTTKGRKIKGTLAPMFCNIAFCPKTSRGSLHTEFSNEDSLYSPPQGLCWPSIPTSLQSNNKAVSYQAQGAVSAPLTSCYRAVFPNCSDGQWGETVPRDGFQNVPRDSIGNLFFGSVFLDCPPYPAILSSSRVRLKQSGSEPRSRLPWRTGHVQGTPVT